MRRRIHVKGLALGLCALLMAAAPAAAQTSGSAADQSAGYSYEKKHEAVSYGKKLMSDFDVKMKDLEAQISRDASAAKADAQRQLKDLKAQRAETGPMEKAGKEIQKAGEKAPDKLRDATK